jgi:proline iminopeptidase
MSDGGFTVDTDDGAICGSVSGDGRELLLLHGGPGLSDYTELLDGETRDWRTVRYQQRGLAPSSVEGPFNVARHVADAVAVLDAVVVDKAVLLGHSWGAHLALQVALAHPERVLAVVAVDGLGPTGDGGAMAFGAELRRRLGPDSLERLVEIDRRPPGQAVTDAEALESLALFWPAYFADPSTAPPLPPDLRLSARCSTETLKSVLEQLADSSFARRLARLEVPAITVVGEVSPMPARVGEEMAGLLPRGELVVVPGAGHLPWHEQPGCIAEVLTALKSAAI